MSLSRIAAISIFLFAFVMLLSQIASADYAIQWSIPSCAADATGSACIARTGYCCHSGIASGSVPYAVTGAVDPKDVAQTLYDALYGGCSTGDSFGPDWIETLSFLCGTTGFETKDVYRGMGSMIRRLDICSSGDDEVTGAFQCIGYGVSRKGVWSLAEASSPVTTISVTSQDGNNIAFSLTCSDPDSGCSTTYFKVVREAESCGTSGYETGTSGSIVCNSLTSCGRKVCYYSTDFTGNSESIKASKIDYQAIVDSCESNSPFKLVCESYQDLSCTIRQGNCLSGEGTVLQLSSLYADQLAAVPGAVVSGYANNLCCSLDSQPVSVLSGGVIPGQFIISLSSESDAKLSYSIPYSGAQLFFPTTVSCALEESDPVYQEIEWQGKTFGNGGIANPYIIDKHDYLCYYDGLPKIAECCGGNKLLPNGQCNSTINGKSFGGVRKVAGEKVTHNISGVQENVSYCTTTNKFDSDLDKAEYGNWSCDKTVNPKAQFRWSGRYCCSEAHDLEEFYNDNNGKGVCYNRTFFANEQALNYDGHTYSELFIKNGTIYGCAVAENAAGAPGSLYSRDPNKPYNGSFNGIGPDNDWLLLLKDYPNSRNDRNNIAGKPVLVKDRPYCSVIGPKSSPKKYFCSYLEVWADGLGRNRTHLSYINWTPADSATQRAECCEKDKCWDGSVCVDSFHIDASKAPNQFGVRCMNGFWEVTPVKYSWNKRYSGYCPSSTQCLVDPLGKYSNNGRPEKFGSETSHNTNPQCINSTQFIGDYYCDAGNWTTRTKLMISKMIGFAGTDDFTLFCDTYDISLNNYEYSLRPDGTYHHLNSNCRALYDSEDDIYKVYFGNGRRPECRTNCSNAQGQTQCANNFCVMHVYRSNPLTIIGTTLNQPANSPYYPFTDLLGASASCSNVVQNDNTYYSCTGANAWYNPQLKTIVFSSKGFSFSGNAWSLLQGWIKAIISYLTGKDVYDQYPFITEDSLVQKAYVDKHGTKRIFAIMGENIYHGGSPNAYLYLNYENFAGNICQAFNASYPLDNSANAYSCESQGANGPYKIIADSGSPVMDDWIEFTAKLRVR
jgi:hypothetical protein